MSILTCKQRKESKGMFDWLKNGMVDYIIGVYQGLFNGFNNVYSIAIMSPSAFNKDIWDIVTKFNKTAVLPIAWSILSLFMLLELASLFKRADVKGLDGLYWIMQILLKIMIAKIVMENMTTIIDAIFEVSGAIVNNAHITLQSLPKNTTTELSDALSQKNEVELLGYFVCALIVNIGSSICTVLAEIIVKLRFIEIYVFTGIAAIPFATLPSKEYGVIGQNFIKRMCALALHCVFIILVLYIYTVL